MGTPRHTNEDQSPEEGLYGLMRAAGISSVRELSEKTGISTHTIVDCHHRRRRPNTGTVWMLAHALKVDVDLLKRLVSAPEG